MVRALEEKLQQLHKEKVGPFPFLCPADVAACAADDDMGSQSYRSVSSLSQQYTLEQALLSASQEIEMNADNPAAIQTVVLQRDDLQNGLLSTCRELSRATAVSTAVFPEAWKSWLWTWCHSTRRLRQDAHGVQAEAGFSQSSFRLR